MRGLHPAARRRVIDDVVVQEAAGVGQLYGNDVAHAGRWILSEGAKHRAGQERAQPLATSEQLATRRLVDLRLP